MRVCATRDAFVIIDIRARQNDAPPFPEALFDSRELPLTVAIASPVKCIAPPRPHIRMKVDSPFLSLSFTARGIYGTSS